MKRLAILLGLLGGALLGSVPATPLFAAPRTHHDVLSSKKEAHHYRSSSDARSSGQATASSRSSFLRHRRYRSRYRRRHYRRVRLPKAPTPDRIEQIQSGLARAGYYKGEPNGKWDASTVNSMKRFQQAQGLAPTGKIDALTLQKLGLGSDIAGVSAPKPIPPAPPAAPTTGPTRE